MTLIVSMKPQYVLLQWAADRLALPSGMWTPESKAIGILDEQRIRAVMVLNGFSGEGCEGSFVSDGSKTWANAGIVAEFLGIPFKIFGMPRLSARVRATDTDTQIFCLRLGFQFDARIRAAMPDGSDAVFFSMLRSEQPFAQGGHDGRQE